MEDVRVAAEVSSPVGRSDEILEAATRLFHRLGYANVGMRSIADEVEIRPASIYHHFPSKESILYALAIRVTEQWIEEAKSLLYTETDPRTAIKNLIRRAVEFEWKNRAAFEVSYRELREMTSDHMADLVFHRASYRRMVESHIERGIASGHFHVANPGLAALAIIDIQNGVNQWFKEPGATKRNAVKSLTIEQVAVIYADLIADHLLL